jgi:hypothetical protein
MIDSSRLDQTFVQIENSCVLSSYGIVANYFARVNIHNVFTEYCQIFLLPFLNDIEHEFSSSKHLNCICPDILHWKGYQMINYLHNISNNAFFLNNRGLFTASILSLEPLVEDQYLELLFELLEHPSLANVLVGEVSPFHSKTVGYDENRGLFTHDTLVAPNMKLSYIADLHDLNIKECIMYRLV